MKLPRETMPQRPVDMPRPELPRLEHRQSSDQPLSPQPRILLVDDEPCVLDGLARLLRREFIVETATSAPMALALLHEAGREPFEVIVSDARMPGMDGVRLLVIARDVMPDAVRVLLTGQADLSAAVAAVNDGQVFRFLQKPCATDMLLGALRAAATQHRLVVAERVLLEQTLHGSVQVLAEVLAAASPTAFARAVRLRRIVSELATALKVADCWQVELAAMLSQLGCVTVPESVLERWHRGDDLTANEQALVDGVPEATERLIAHIPRLEAVRAIIRAQRTGDGGGDADGRSVAGQLAIAARLLRLAADFDELDSQQNPLDVIFQTLDGRAGLYDPAALRALRMLRQVAASTIVVREIPLSEARVGMVFATDVVAASGLLLVARGQEVTPALRERISGSWTDVPLLRPVRVITKTAI